MEYLTPEVIYALIGGVLTIGLIMYLFTRRRKKLCWRCRKRYPKSQMLFMATVDDWTCQSCDKVIRTYISVQ